MTEITRGDGDVVFQNGRAGDDVREFANGPHHLSGIADSFFVTARLDSFDADNPFIRQTKTSRVTLLKPIPNENGAFSAEHGLDVELLEPLRLRLSANEKRDATGDAEETDEDGTFALADESQRDVQRRRHRY